jgi:hypothetical protein
VKTTRPLLFHSDIRGFYIVPAGTPYTAAALDTLPAGEQAALRRRLAQDRKAGKDPVLVELAGQARVLERADVERSAT